MASIRRTMSASNRPWPQQQNSRPPPLRLPSSYALLRFSLMALRRLLFHHRYPRRLLKSSAARYLVLFVVGFLLGFFPFANLTVDVAPPRDFTFEIQSSVENGRSWEEVGVDGGKKLLIVVTPTYNRALQAYYLARLGQTLRLVPPPLLWIVVEMGTASMETADVLRNSGVMYRHLVCLRNSSELKDRGIHQRNVALEHIERHRMDGIVYFADDDNIYSLELFEQMREVRRFGTWPVAMLAKSKRRATLEGPVCNGGQIIGWHTNEKSKRLRRFHVDMSGFAFSSTILWNRTRWHRPAFTVRQLDTIKEGFQETTFIQQVVEDEFQMEAIPSGCSKIMNWHLHLDSRGIFYPKGWRLLKNLEAVIPL